MAVIQLQPYIDSTTASATRASRPGTQRPREGAFHAELETALENFSSSDKEIAQRFTFRVTEKDGEPLIQIRNPRTQEVLREVTPPELLQVVKNIRDTIGLKLDGLL